MNGAIKYTKLPGRGRTWAYSSRLWLGPDHILAVQSYGYSEAYKRFFFPEIQALVVTRTLTGALLNAVFGFLAGFFGLIGFAQGGDALIGWGIVASIFLIAFSINAALGPTCKCQIRTAVQTERLVAVGRLRTARKLLARIGPLIDSAQGHFAPDQFAVAFDQRQGFAVSPTASAATSQPLA